MRDHPQNLTIFEGSANFVDHSSNIQDTSEILQCYVQGLSSKLVFRAKNLISLVKESYGIVIKDIIIIAYISRVLMKANEIEHLDKRKVQIRLPKNRRPFDTKKAPRKSPLSVRIALREFSSAVLEKCYNTLMNSCKDTVSALVLRRLPDLCLLQC